jgi:hypothetical protein
MSAVSPGLGVLILGNSIFEGVGTALLIPPVYILSTMLFTDLKRRAFGVISGMRVGKLLGRRSAVSSPPPSAGAAFVFQAVVIAVIFVLGRRIVGPVAPDPIAHPSGVLSATGLVILVMGILAADATSSQGYCSPSQPSLPVLRLPPRGALQEPLLSTRLFRTGVQLRPRHPERQWAVLGTSFTVSAYLQVVLANDPVQRDLHVRHRRHGGSSLRPNGSPEVRAADFDHGGLRRHDRRDRDCSPWLGRPVWACARAPVLGLGVGVMLTPSVNVVQSAFPENLQGEISGLSRSVSNLGSSIGTAIAGTILVSGLTTHAYGAAMIVLAVIGLVGLAAAVLLPREPAHAVDA